MMQSHVTTLPPPLLHCSAMQDPVGVVNNATASEELRNQTQANLERIFNAPVSKLYADVVTMCGTAASVHNIILLIRLWNFDGLGPKGTQDMMKMIFAAYVGTHPTSNLILACFSHRLL
jgi:hypothetical protein